MAFAMAETSLPLALRRLLLIFVALLWGATLVSAQKFDINPRDHLCSRWYSQSVVKNNVLFIDGGVQKFGDVWNDPRAYLGINNYLITIPLNYTWDWKNQGSIANITINAEPKNETNPRTGTLPPSLIRGHLFHGPTSTSEILNFGGTTFMGNRSFEGYIQPDSSTYALWGYTYGAQNDAWMQYDISQPWRANHGAAAEAIDQNLGFYLNGQIDGGTSTKTLNAPASLDIYRPLDGMLVINFTDHTSTNISTAKLRDGTPRVGGEMEYLPSVGRLGVLIALGGQTNDGSAWVNTTKGKLLDFTSVDVFDINSYIENPSQNGTWYQQTTTGTIPPARIDFCTVSISAPDNSSHHIYVYGGIDPTLNKAYDDVYVLSIPSFSWTPIFSIGESPRWGHNCHVVGKRQMITVGGNLTDKEYHPRCDWESKGVALLDLSDVTWGSVFLSNASAYRIPQAIVSAPNATNGTRDGNAKIKEPVKGWTDAGLKTVFAASRLTTPIAPAPTPSSTPIASKNSIVGPIAGGVAGGVLVLAVIAGILFYLRWRRNKKRAPAELDSDGVEAGEPGKEKDGEYELQGVTEIEPVELPGPEAVELNAPREFVEADNTTATHAAELSGTSIAPGGSAGTPQVRTPGDDLPETPFYTPGLRRRSSIGFTTPPETKEATEKQTAIPPGTAK